MRISPLVWLLGPAIKAIPYTSPAFPGINGNYFELQADCLLECFLSKFSCYEDVICDTFFILVNRSIPFFVNSKLVTWKSRNSEPQKTNRYISQGSPKKKQTQTMTFYFLPLSCFKSSEIMLLLNYTLIFFYFKNSTCHCKILKQYRILWNKKLKFPKAGFYKTNLSVQNT